MRIIDHTIELDKKSGRVEFFLFGDTHIGKRNCAEGPIRKQVAEVVRRAEKPGRVIRVLFGGDINDYVKPGDVKRWNVNVLADWIYKGTPAQIRKRLNNVAPEQLKRSLSMLEPLKPFAIGGLEGNHEFAMMQHNNFDMQAQFCDAMGMEDLTDEALIRVKFKYRTTTQTMKIYMQHGHGGGRTAGAEPNHLERLRSEWEDADVVLRGHSHTFGTLPPKPVMYLPNRGKLPAELLQRYRYAANWGCWLYSHRWDPRPMSHEQLIRPGL